MPLDTFIALLTLAFAAAWTPGPNNAMLAASGATFGVRRTAPHALGVTFGFPVMIFLIALGLGRLVQDADLFRLSLRWAGVALLLWIAWRIATTPTGAGAEDARPFTMFQAMAFQWVNPKSWAMALAITTQFATGAALVTEAGLIAGVFILAGLTSAFSWAAFGAALGRWLGRGRRLQAFNIAMGALIALAAVYLAFESV